MLPAPNPATAAPSPASQAVRRNDRRLTCGFLAAGRGLAGRTPSEIAIDSLPRSLELEEQTGLVRMDRGRAGLGPRPHPLEAGAPEERAGQDKDRPEHHEHREHQ